MELLPPLSCGAQWLSVAWCIPSLWFAGCGCNLCTNPSLRTGCSMFCCRLWHTQFWLCPPSLSDPTLARPFLLWLRPRYCCFLSGFTTHGTPSYHVFVQRREHQKKE